jgi:hypothetical protein
MSSSSTSVSEGPERSRRVEASSNGTAEDPEASRRTEDQTTPVQPTEAQLNFREAPGFIHNRPDLARHRRKCSICRHPERDTIEDLFIHWHSPNTIANFFDDTADAAEDAGDESHNRLRITWVAIYRHAYAVGLDEVRRRNLRFAFEHILEQAGDITPTSASIMAAARAYAACLNNDGQWNDPPKQVIVTNIIKRDEVASAPSDIVAAGLSRQPSPSAATSDVIPNPAAPGCVSRQNENDADGGEGPAVAFASSPLTANGTPITGYAPFTSSEIRIPPNSLITNASKISNR